MKNFSDEHRHFLNQDDPDCRLFPLSRAPKEVESITGVRPHVATIFRWRQRGLHGVRLRTLVTSGGRRTCRRWLIEFFEAATQAADSQIPAASLPVGVPTASARQLHEEAERMLAAAGM